MYHIIALSISILLQIIAAVFALSLLKRTRYNFSWILISGAFVMIAVRTTFDLIYLISYETYEDSSYTSSLLSVIISIPICIGAFYIRKIFNVQERIDAIRKENEALIFSAIIKTEERERYLFAKELHDGLGPILSSIKMVLSALNQTMVNEQNKQILLKSNYAIDEAIITIKEISNKLSPHVLTNFGLEKALKNFIDTININNFIDIHIKSNLNVKRFDFTIETVVYRVVCEMITNTIKHADAKRIDIEIDFNDKVMTILYTDNGKGFDISNVEFNGMGLSNIQSRIKSINGNVIFESYTNKGFKTKIYIKINE